MVSDQELTERLRVILSESDLNVVTIKTVRKQLEDEFGEDLTAKKKLLRSETEHFLEERKQAEQRAEEEAEEEEGRAGKRKKPEKGKRAKKGEKKERKKRRTDGEGGGGGGGLNKMCALSEDLAAIVGVREAPRTQVVKLIWEHIKENNLQDPSNKRQILCDEALEKLFGVPSTDMFNMNKLLSNHIKTLPNLVNGEPVEKKAKKEVGDKMAGNVFMKPQLMSAALQSFFGDGESHSKRSDVVKRMWDYIKVHELQDPADRRRVICDEKMKTLFGVEMFNGFGMTKLLTPHFLKSEEAAPPAAAAAVEAVEEAEVEGAAVEDEEFAGEVEDLDEGVDEEEEDEE
eukprot:jgi/Mesen1/8972/ME000056S08376